MSNTNGKHVGLGALALLVALALSSSSCLAQWDTLWSDGFDTCSNWTVTIWTCAASQLKFAPSGAQLNSWKGPAYRSVAGSDWNMNNYREVRVEYNFLRFNLVTPNTQTKQFALVVETGHANAPDTTTNPKFFEIRLWQSGASGTYGWNVTNHDGTLTEKFNYPIENLQDRDVYANLTMNIDSQRFWINWTTYIVNTFIFSSSGAITGTWNDSTNGWYGGIQPYKLNWWGYSSVATVPGDIFLTAINLYGWANPYFTVTTDQPTLEVEQDSAGTLGVNVAGFSGWTDSIDMTLDSPPPGVTGSCVPSTLTPDDSCILTVNVALTVGPGTYMLTVLGTSSTLTNFTVFDLTVTEIPGRLVLHGEVHADMAIATSDFGTQFYDASTAPGKIVKWEWSFGDGYGSLRENPFHAYACHGTYFVSLLVQDEWGNRGSISTLLTIEKDRPLCGLIQPSEEGVTVTAAGERLTVPTGAFILLAVFSATTLTFGIDFTLNGRDVISRRARILLLVVAIVGLVFTVGIVGTLVIVGLPGPP